jgi:type I restriction enzyme M protein
VFPLAPAAHCAKTVQAGFSRQGGHLPARDGALRPSRRVAGDTNVGEALRDAMIAIEDSVTDQNGQKLLAGALPKDYLGLEQDLLAELLKIFNSPLAGHRQGRCVRPHLRILPEPVRAEWRAGRRRVLHAAQPGAHDRERHRTRPRHVLDPACGSAGMFVQTGHFIEDARHRSMQEVDITFYGQEKADLNSKLARMNLAVHGLEGNIRIGNTFYEDHHQLLGACDFVMANPPFNVDGVQVTKNQEPGR